MLKIAAEFQDIKMFGSLIKLCGYDLNNACAVEYHVKMFNGKKNNGWTINRFMSEIGMITIDEGVSLNQLIPLYIKYRIGFHVVDFKYHIASSYHEYNYQPNTNYLRLFYMIENNHLYPITNKEHQHSLSQLKDKPHKTFKSKEEKPVKRIIHMLNKPDEILIMLGLMKTDEVDIFEYSQCQNCIFVSVFPGLVHDLFYMLLKNKNYTTKILK